MTTTWEACSGKPVTADVATTMRTAAEQMSRAGVGALLVLDRGMLVGIVTDRDLVVRGVAHGLPPQTRIEALMTIDPVTVPCSADLSRAYRLLRDHDIRRLPVVDGLRPVGLLSVDDLAVRTANELHDVMHPAAGEIDHPDRSAPSAGPAGAAHHAGPPTAENGDTLVFVRPRDLPPRAALVVGTSTAGRAPYLVRWADTGRESYVFPRVDTEVRRVHPAAS